MVVFRTIILGTILLFIALVAGPYIAIQFDFVARPIPLGILRYLGVLPMLFGLPLTAWCAFLLIVPGENRPIPYDSPVGLVVSGPYQYTRNPFLAGWLLVLWGEVIFICSVMLLIYALILTICVHFWVLAYEEPSLEDRYGEEYKKYEAKVPRWFPKLKGKN